MEQYRLDQFLPFLSIFLLTFLERNHYIKFFQEDFCHVYVALNETIKRLENCKKDNFVKRDI